MPALEGTRLGELVVEAQRQFSICNACRYCEGYCAAFPALERRLAFDEGDMHYLANLCHNCGACLYACQYAPPHEFRVNFPKLLAQARKATYRKYAWPRRLGASFERNGVVVAIVTAVCIALLFLFTAWYADPTRFLSAHPDAQGSFYAVLPHGVMVSVSARCSRPSWWRCWCRSCASGGTPASAAATICMRLRWATPPWTPPRLRISTAAATVAPIPTRSLRLRGETSIT
jgi:CitB-like protein